MTFKNNVLDAQALLAAAEAATGLRDYGDDSLPERFSMAVQKLTDADMDAAGQHAGAQVCHDLLSSRLQFFDDHKTFNLSEEVISQPMVATGEPRSGTTLLHALLSLDPDARALRFWEVMYPSPPPGLAAQDDPRPAKADSDWREILQRIPKWIVSHPYNDMLGNGLPECERTWAFDFRVMTPTAWWKVPMGMNIGGLPVDPPAQYRIHKMMLQLCQYGREKKRWVLKGFHGPRLPAFFAAYPDARIIWIHRDPVQVIASRIAMAVGLAEGLVGHASWQEQAAIHLAASRAGFENTLNNPMIDDPRIHHVRFVDFTADPVGTIAEFYQFCGFSMREAAAAAMRDYLINNKANRYGKFHYTTDSIGVDVEDLHKEFAPYRQRFGLDIEER
ncbi:MAG: sulfotransferase family protein [Gammaproteobacteria bacterium]